MNERKSKGVSNVNIIVAVVSMMLIFSFGHILPALSGEYSGPGKIPDRIILNVTEDPSTSMAVNWRTDTTVTASLAQIAVVQPGPFIENIRKVKAKVEKVKITYEGEPTIIAHYHAALFDSLTADQKYMYRVGHGKIWSEWFHFKTAAGQDKPFSFIYQGDVQSSIGSLWPRVMREAYAKDPDAGFIVYAGDLINRSGRDVEWEEWFEGGDYIHASIPSAMTPGNHEYSREMVLDPHWRPQFNLPDNGIKGLEETCYFFDYNDLRLLSIDTDMGDEFEWAETGQAQWLDSVLTLSDKKWTALLLHYPFYSTKASRDNVELRQVFGPILEKHKVDIVLQGHDHAYGRGMRGIPSFTNPAQKTGTMFVVSVSGSKMYEAADRDWMTRRADKTQLFQIISIEGDKLNYRAYTATGELFDEFDLIKQKGKENWLIDKAPPLPEKTVD